MCQGGISRQAAASPSRAVYVVVLFRVFYGPGFAAMQLSRVQGFCVVGTDTCQIS
jgi:hypothetical protein